MSCPNELTNELPFFVYGTLRHGLSNYHLLRGRTQQEESATLEGMYLFSFGPYPIILESAQLSAERLASYSPPAILQGELMNIPAALYAEVRSDLDALEDFFPDNLVESRYWRVAREVQITDGRRVCAWVYIGNPQWLEPNFPPYVPHGDWKAHYLQTHQRQQHEWHYGGKP